MGLMLRASMVMNASMIMVLVFYTISASIKTSSTKTSAAGTTTGTGTTASTDVGYVPLGAYGGPASPEPLPSVLGWEPATAMEKSGLEKRTAEYGKTAPTVVDKLHLGGWCACPQQTITTPNSI